MFLRVIQTPRLRNRKEYMSPPHRMFLSSASNSSSSSSNGRKQSNVVALKQIEIAAKMWEQRMSMETVRDMIHPSFVVMKGERNPSSQQRTAFIQSIDWDKCMSHFDQVIKEGSHYRPLFPTNQVKKSEEGESAAERAENVARVIADLNSASTKVMSTGTTTTPTSISSTTSKKGEPQISAKASWQQANNSIHQALSFAGMNLHALMMKSISAHRRGELAELEDAKNRFANSRTNLDEFIRRLQLTRRSMKLSIAKEKLQSKRSLRRNENQSNGPSSSTNSNSTTTAALPATSNTSTSIIHSSIGSDSSRPQTKRIERIVAMNGLRAKLAADSYFKIISAANEAMGVKITPFPSFEDPDKLDPIVQEWIGRLHNTYSRSLSLIAYADNKWESSVESTVNQMFDEMNLSDDDLEDTDEDLRAFIDEINESEDGDDELDDDDEEEFDQGAVVDADNEGERNAAEQDDDDDIVLASPSSSDLTQLSNPFNDQQVRQISELIMLDLQVVRKSLELARDKELIIPRHVEMIECCLATCHYAISAFGEHSRDNANMTTIEIVNERQPDIKKVYDEIQNIRDLLDITGKDSEIEGGLFGRIVMELQNGRMPYQPSVRRRKRKHGFLYRNSYPGGRKVIQRRREKGRKQI